MTTFVEEISTKLTFVKARRRPQTIFESMPMQVRRVGVKSGRCTLTTLRRGTSAQNESSSGQRRRPEAHRTRRYIAIATDTAPISAPRQRAEPTHEGLAKRADTRRVAKKEEFRWQINK